MHQCKYLIYEVKKEGEGIKIERKGGKGEKGGGSERKRKS
jgi:hypothetical protein